jgi:dihydroxyacetone kinase
MELLIASGKAIAQIQKDYGLVVERVYTGSFMTSLDMKGKCLGGFSCTG